MAVGRARALSIGAVCGPAVPLDLTHRLEGDRAVVPSQAKTSPLHMPLQDAESSLQVRRTLKLDICPKRRRTRRLQRPERTKKWFASKGQRQLPACPGWVANIKCSFGLRTSLEPVSGLLGSPAT